MGVRGLDSLDSG